MSDDKPAEAGPKEPWERDPVPPEWLDASGDPVAVALVGLHGPAIESARSFAGDLTFQVKREAIAEVAHSLKAVLGFDLLIDICGADYSAIGGKAAPAGREPRFDVVYHAFSTATNGRVRLKVATDEDTPIPTLCGVWRGANWPEREVFDLYGIRFEGHPDLSRILLWDGFNGHPLRKDFPVEGIDTGAAAYPEKYDAASGPVAGTGTGWKPPAAIDAGPTPGALGADPINPSEGKT